MSGYRGDRDYDDESDADDEYERSMKSPAIQGAYPTSPTESDGPFSAENTPTTQNRNPPFPSPTGVITKWTADQCADFIANIGFENYADAFAEEEINGEALIELHHEELKDLGIVSVGHRLTILKAVYDVKIKHNVTIQQDHYVPLSADANAPDAHATQDDIVRIINQIRLRDERSQITEEEVRTMRETLDRVVDDTKRLREDVLPVIRMAKDRNQPLPTPEGVSHIDLVQPTRMVDRDSLPSPMSIEGKSGGLSRKYSTQKLFLGSSGKMPSPTIHETSTLDPSAAAKAASSQLTASMSSSSQPSPRSPTSPPYQTASYSRNGPTSRFASTPEEWTHSNGSIIAAGTSRRTTTTSTKTNTLSSLTDDHKNESSRDSRRQRDRDGEAPAGVSDFMKSFRVSMDEPCEKVLPIALKKYKIYDDWRQYSLYIVHGDQERCLGLDEKPLILFKQLASEGRKPMFMLRKHAPEERDSNTGGPAGVGSLTGNAAGRTSYAASTLQLPGGVI